MVERRIIPPRKEIMNQLEHFIIPIYINPSNYLSHISVSDNFADCFRLTLDYLRDSYVTINGIQTRMKPMVGLKHDENGDLIKKDGKPIVNNKATYKIGQTQYFILQDGGDYKNFFDAMADIEPKFFMRPPKLTYCNTMEELEYNFLCCVGDYGIETGYDLNCYVREHLWFIFATYQFDCGDYTKYENFIFSVNTVSPRKVRNNPQYKTWNPKVCMLQVTGYLAHQYRLENKD